MTDHDTSQSVDEWAELEAGLDVDPGSDWEPEPGDRLIGTVRDIDYRRTSDGRVLPILTLDTRDGQALRVPAGRAALLAQLLKHRVQPGDLLGVQFDGKIIPSGGGREYFGYRVTVRHTADRGADVLRDPATMTVDASADLVAGAESDPWASGNGSQSPEEVPF